MQRLGEIAEYAAARCLADLGVKGMIALDESADLSAAILGIAGAVEDGLQIQNVLRGGMQRRLSGNLGFDGETGVEELDDLADRVRLDDDALARHHIDQPFLLQSLQRLRHRGAPEMQQL